ncbi:alpha/beta hydrolase family protein [Leptolyngbya sp. KIOST-1]|uniref:alpha/beta hydrolase family protein n=1 Tax=Leptolyngbya sp. KIOST-1 TaxID=1229172 RepID=UPI0012E047E7|nr:hypothetical protein [Leptolyngbya sp. KIOST-1]
MGPNLADFPLVVSYDLGTTTLDQTGVDPALEAMPIALTGAIALPPGTAPVPWVVVLHGRHAGCHFQPEATSQWPCAGEPRFDLGFAYLAQALAEAGYGVLVPNLNAAFSETYGASAETRNAFADQRSGQIIDNHLNRLALAHRGEEPGFGLPLAGRVDLARLALVGHSMGGGAAARRALERLGSESAVALQGRIAAGGGPVSALVLVSPTRSLPIAERPDAYQLPDVPTAVIAGGCDRDIFDLSSLYYVEMARSQPRTTPVLGLLLPGANHNFFNATVAEDDYYRQANHGSLCNPQRSRDRLSRVAQETFLAQYTAAFLQTVWSPPGITALATVGLAPQRSSPAQLFGQAVLTTLVAPNSQRRTLLEADGASTPVLSPGLRAAFCPAIAPCESSPRPHPHFPARLTLTWDTAAEGLKVPLDPVDVSRFSSLDLRLAPDPAWALPQGQPAFAVVLRDGQGGAARVEIPSTVPALRQFEADPSSGDTALVYPSSLRIPLGQFAGVDLTALTRVELVFDQVPQGQLHLTSIEVVGQRDFGF